VRAGEAGSVLSAIIGAALFSPAFLVSATVLCQAQTLPPLPSFVSPYEIAKIVQSAGFDPLAPALREGTTYVLRATDLNGSLMRVVVDARSGAIRTVSRIVAGPGSYGQIGGLPPSYGSASAGTPDYPAPEMMPDDDRVISSVAATLHPTTRPLIWEPPLPRPRPVELVMRDAKLAAHAKPASSRKPVLVQVPD